ncbi:hypothetical protein M3Y98_00447700 [Aphelenchoides besseyi]|nr:hypothetical protein M3Y98_00447700 [Aphelenchoides besseyi]KAI6207357.1 hypothetical protein M3Y96_00000700 [Aphelenchoides besseyi]
MIETFCFVFSLVFFLSTIGFGCFKRRSDRWSDQLSNDKNQKLQTQSSTPNRYNLLSQTIDEKNRITMQPLRQLEDESSLSRSAAATPTVLSL